MPLTVWLDDPAALSVRSGGKGRSLARLHQDGVPIPPGFVVTADAYELFAEHNNLQPLVSAVLAGADLHLAAAARSLTAPLTERLATAELPPPVTAEVSRAYADLRDRGFARVAVRSSALSEDAASASSAGLYETFLNREGESAVLSALLDCYRSLWSARAVQYRALKRLQAGREAMAAVVLAMVPADVAGVVFTANPLDNNRDQLVINASWGLGESVVSGRVTPDTFILDKATGAIQFSEIAAKEIEIVPDEAGGVTQRDVPADRAARPSLTPVQLRQLAELCRRIEQQHGIPMDIEWAFFSDTLYILQARPITGLTA